MNAMPQQIDRNAPLSVTLTAQGWELVMQVLSEAPYKLVAPVIGSIQNQCLTQHSMQTAQSQQNAEELECR